MGVCCRGAWVLIFALAAVATIGDAQTLVPAVITFGDSAMLGTMTISPPFSRLTIHHMGGISSIIKLPEADTLGFTTYPPAYLSPQASGKNLLIGANFASAASGYDDKTAFLNHAISLSQQLQYYKEYQAKLAKVAGSSKAASIIKDGLYLVSFGSSDFLQNYYVNPFINKVYTPDQYSSYLVGIFQSFITDLHGLGARRIGVTSLPPLGCLPAARTLFGFTEKGCVSRINTDAQGFNKKVNSAATQLPKQLPGLKLVIFDIFKPLYDIVASPSSQGFVEATKGCCGSGTVETTSLLCNPKTPGTCSNASQYVFWDSVHPSQAANQILADSLLLQGIDLIG
ncbi:LOW QUALITY PROTEIN: hypothetical protein RJ639_039906 [Escallonia herrerae]|uniref:GDSL esterase/lipase APG n=1 Tax=Escallonia herrerae TaxID=1293975 RepID=A0AA88WKI4_9ASTE|nr:LOW QUALITY PROTEIN: hypothetical protein RJ639_039906 [Escallonia herrerae]